jgi:hypothetical protein
MRCGHETLAATLYHCMCCLGVEQALVVAADALEAEP